MTPETIAIVAVALALAGLILNGQRIIGARLDRLDARIDKVEARLEKVEAGQAELRERMAHLERLLEGLREAIVHRSAA